MQWARKKSGFTIVELLIVIVVIAILAAITVVAYNGIQNRAKDTALQSAAAQTGKRVLTYGPQNADLYPTEADFATSSFQSSTLNLPAATDAATYDYFTSDDRKKFCVSVANTTTNPVTAYAFTQSGQTVQGRCVKNLTANPSVETGISGSANNASSSIVRSTDRAKDGTTSILVTAIDATNGYNGVNRGATVVAGKTYTFSAWVYLTTQYSTSGVAATSNGVGTTVKQGNFITGVGSWQRTSVSFSPTANGNATIYVITPSSVRPVANSTFYTDSWMFTEGATLYDYADGTYANWSWADTPHASASFGPAIAQ